MAVSEKNTKKEILAEVERLNAQLTAERLNNKTISQIQKEKLVETKKENAKTLIEKNILAPEIMEQYKDVIETIEIKKAELAEIEDMEKAIIDIEAVLMAKESLLAKKEETVMANIEAAENASKERLEQLKIEQETVITEKKAKIEELDKAYKERQIELEKERRREAEDYKYNLERSRRLENDKWEDEKALRELSLSNRESICADREANLDLRDKELEDLKKQVENIPQLIEAAKAEGQKDGESKKGREYAFEKASLTKEAEYNSKLKEAEINRLQEMVKSLEAKTADLEKKLEAAYNNMNELAKTTVTSTGGVNVIATNSEKTK